MAEHSLEGVMPGMSSLEVRQRLTPYCLNQESTALRDGDLLLVYDNASPCRPLSERFTRWHEGNEEQKARPGQQEGFSFLFRGDAVLDATVGWHLGRDASREAAEHLLARLIGRYVQLEWPAGDRVGFLPQPTFASVEGTRLYLTYTVFREPNTGDRAFLTLSTRRLPLRWE